MSGIETVRDSVSDIVRNELASTSVVGVDMREDVSGYDGEPLYRVAVVFEGKRPRPKQVGSMLLHVRKYLWNAGDERFPIFTFLTPKDAEEYYGSRASD